ncbi:alkaline-phosphatase-like protein [Scenedesmus sp. NREL 46B-D3]|nr:alkaline-phosphatase-like protein [Scenedesmus sp. NREL 46B-D3]
MILTDDVGYDDVGFHNPRVKTPNIDKFRQRSMVLDNFYTPPQCAQSRAQFLTGRSYARTGTMAVSGGWDFINRQEVTIGEAMAAGGYRTAHFGKWHNSQVLGYEPWHNGFEDGYMPPPPGAAGEGLARKNGRYVIAREEGHLYDKALRNQTIEYLQQRVKDGEPFFVFLAGRNYMLPDPVTGKPTQRRVVPPQYREKFNRPGYNGITDSTKDAWAFMEYLDDAMGPLFDYLAAAAWTRALRHVRMPSGMAGSKHSVQEGGIRNCLIVQGPGVKPGAIDSTMVAISDIFSTLVDLAGVGFYNAGDSMCFKLKVMKAGTYSATATYTSNIRGTFRLSVGSYADIKAGSARSLTATWPAQDVMRGMTLGNLTLPASGQEMTEACLELLDGPTLNGRAAVFRNLANIQWTRVSGRRVQAPRVADPAGKQIDASKRHNSRNAASKGGSADQGGPNSSRISTASLPAPAVAADELPVAVPAPGLDLAGEYSWVRSAVSSDVSVAHLASPQDDWTALRLKHGWPDGQSVLESMFSPYESEGLEDCPADLHAACLPPV